MMETARSNRSPVDGIANTLNDRERFSLCDVKCLIQELRIVRNQPVDSPLGELPHSAWGVHGPGHDLPSSVMHLVDQAPLN
jgi:hypothetical protein